MSIDGVLDNNKHGGAHELSHETGSISDNNDFYVVVSNNSLRSQNKTDGDCDRFQDGGAKRQESDEAGYIPESLQFLSDDLDKYEQAVLENNAEWLKARCGRPLDPVEFDIGAQPSSNLELLGIMDESVIASNPVSMSDLPSLSAASNDSTTSEGQTLVQTSDMLVSDSNSETNVLTDQSGQLVQTPVTMVTNLQNYTSPEIQLGGVLLDSNKEQDIVLGSSINDVHTVLNSNNIHQYQNSFTNNVTLTDSDNTKSYVKVVMKDGVLTLVPNEEAFTENTTKEQEIAENTMVLKSDTISQVPENGSTIVEPFVQSQNVISFNDTEMTSTNGQVVLPTINNTENLALATISISNDKLANSTKILVDTNQGQQLYQLNMSDLTALLNQPSNGPLTDQQQISASFELMPKEDQFSETMPGYLLLSVTNKDGSEDGGSLTGPNNSSSQVQSTSVTNHRQKSEPMYMCTYEGCGKLFRSLAKLSVHNMTHTGERPYKCSEPGCDWAFTQAYKLKRHEESHKGIKDFICDVCNKRFTTIYNLNSHKKGHDRPCTEECPVESCGLKFQTRRELDRHLKTHEGIEKTYKCPFEGCNKLFLSPHCLGSHPRVHMADPVNLTCQFEGCGRKFDKLCRLKQHQRAHTGERPYRCHFEGCNWAFSSASKLTRHMTKHTNKRKWICNECGKGFMRAEHLKGHMITHSGIKPFECPVPGCGQKFVAKSSVYSHLKKHNTTDKKITYHCPMDGCNKKYTNKAKLRQHIVKHFPGTLKPEDAAQLDIVPLFKNREEIGGDTNVQTSAVNVKTEADGTMKIDPVEFIATSVNKEGEVTTSVSNQFTAELTAELSNLYTATKTKSNEAESSPSQPKISFKKEGVESSGSARTDYLSNKLLSDRAKKRRKLLKEKAEGRTSSEDPLEQTNSPTEETKPLSVADALCSHGITFRDPSTGVLYVQMQLLQDDPPHPDLYTDDAIMSSNITLPDTSSTDIQEHNTCGQTSEFVGSTINLQDLV